MHPSRYFATCTIGNLLQCSVAEILLPLFPILVLVTVVVIFLATPSNKDDHR